MSALPALAPNPSNNAASARSSASGASGAPTGQTEDSGTAANFASLLVARAPANDQFAALQRIKAELDVPVEGALPAADVGALLAEISLPLAPSTLLLVPVAQTAQSLLAGTTTAPSGLTREELPLLGTAIDADSMADLAMDSERQPLLPDRSSGTTKAEFRLPETSALAVAQALTSPTHAQGPTAAHAPGGQAVFAASQPLHSPQWSSEVGTNMAWMARQGIQTAQLAINPSHLGPIEITLSLNRDHATAYFVSAHAEVREVLEQSLPRLREILESAGVQLGQADVGSRSQQQFAGTPSGSHGNGPTSAANRSTLSAENAVVESGVTRVRHGNGLIDTFA